MCKGGKNARGFTLIELLVVIAIIAILAAILFPVFASARDRAKLAKCMMHLKQCGVASLMYLDDNESCFVPGRITDSQGKTIAGWPEGQCVGGKAGRFATGGGLGAEYTPPQFRPLNKYVKTIEFFHCPSEQKQDCAGAKATFPWDRFGNSYNFNVTFYYPNASTLNYTLNYMKGNQVTGRKIADVKNPRRMIMMGERPIHYWYGIPAGATDPKPIDPTPMLGHGGGKPWTPVVFCDGHVEYILMTPGISGKTWELMQTDWQR